MRVEGEAPFAGPASMSRPRFVQAAHEFEAQMMKELLKPMAGSADLDEDDSASGSNGALADFASGALGESLSRAGGLGIAETILRNISQHGTPGQTSPS